MSALPVGKLSLFVSAQWNPDFGDDSQYHQIRCESPSLLWTNPHSISPVGEIGQAMMGG